MKVRCEIDANGKVISQTSVSEWTNSDPGLHDGIELRPCYILDGQRIVIPDRPSLAHEWDWSSKAWVVSLAFAKVLKWEAVKSWRDSRVFAAFTWNGWTFDADERSRARISEAGLEALMIAAQGEFQSYDWVLADNTTATLSEQQMLLMSRALRTRTSQLHLAANARRQQIDAATTVAQVEAITMPADPPPAA